MRGFPLIIAVFMSLFVPGAAAQPLVDADWVKNHACDPNVRVLDLRDNHRLYMLGHVPCAVHAPYGRGGWQRKVDDVPGMAPSIDILVELVRALGITMDQQVVLVADGGSALAMTTATRVYWTLSLLGHQNLSILDGGFAAYRAAPDSPLSNEDVAVTPSAFDAELNANLLAEAADIETAIDGGQTLIDSRLSDYFVGINSSPIVARPGTLPGAENLPITWQTDSRGRFHDPAFQGQILAAAGLDSAEAPILFCNSGRMASLGWFVAHELLGKHDARLYDGSMAQWAMDAGHAVERRVDTP